MVGYYGFSNMPSSFFFNSYFELSSTRFSYLEPVIRYPFLSVAREGRVDGGPVQEPVPVAAEEGERVAGRGRGGAYAVGGRV